MPNYHYTALNPQGKKVHGEITAPTELAARKSVKEKGLFVVKMGEESSRFRLSSLFSFFSRSETISTRVPIKELVFFTRQLSTLLRSGFTLDGALGAISEQMNHPGFHKAILQIDASVKEGSTLHDAMARYPNIFSEIYVSLVKAGEASGQLPPILAKLSQYLDGQVKLKNKLLATMTYPFVMLVASIAVVSVLMVYVVPSITEVLLAQNKVLPTSTQILISSSNFFRDWGRVMFLLFLLLLWLFRQYRKTKGGRKLTDRLLLKIPLVGSVAIKIAISRFSSTFAVLLHSGVDILKSLAIVKDVMGNVVLQETIERSSRNLGEGNSLAQPLKESGVFPPIVIKMIDVGQRSGNLELMLETISSDYDNEVENTILALTSILEPMIIVFMAGFVTFIVVAVLVPLQEMANI